MTKQKGYLFVVATPIGNLADISQRALETLASVDWVAAEDTRHSKKLLRHFKVDTPLIALHSHNEQTQQHHLLEKIKKGESIALISDAGTPLISDPGYLLVQMAHKIGIRVIPIAGVCALITALSAAGFAADRFVFEGFLPVKSAARVQRLALLKQETRTWVVYEAPHRIIKLFDDILTVLGEDRLVVLARELTKQFETIKSGSVQSIREYLLSDPMHCKGEFVVVIHGNTSIDEKKNEKEGIRVVQLLLDELPLKQAVKLAAKITDSHKNSLYEWALKHKN